MVDLWQTDSSSVVYSPSAHKIVEPLAEGIGTPSNRVGRDIRPDLSYHICAGSRGSFVKRMFDVVLSIAGLVAISPLFIVVAVAIRIESPGPVFFLQRRYGLGRKPFMIWKFRSMVQAAEKESFRQVSRDDGRVTQIGRILRRSNLDELPQLWNVLNGTMSLVGPRPHPTMLDEEFEILIADYRRRFEVKPGMTGWAQINGLRGETITDASMQMRIEHDIFYVANGTFWLDVKILFWTLFSMKTFDNAY